MLSYLVSCQAEKAASHPGLATCMKEYYFQGSWEVWGFQGPGSGGSYQALGAVKSNKIATMKTSAELLQYTNMTS